jgi:opacity protein-like surface antigen
MGSLKTLALAGAVFAGATAVASAADLRYPQPVGLPPPPLAAPMAEASGWYLRGDIGIGALDAQKLRYSDNPVGVLITDRHFGAQFLGGIGAGYQVNSWFRFDVTGEYRGATKFGIRDEYSYTAGTVIGRGSNDVRGKISSMVLLANAYLDLGTWHGLTPYIGAGVGLAQNKTSGGTDRGVSTEFDTATKTYKGGGTSNSTFKGATKSATAFALMAGVSAEVSQNLKVDVGYRYLNLGKFQTGSFACGGCTYSLQGRDLDSHEIRIGLRWMLGGPGYAPAPASYPVEPPRLVKKF